MCLYNVHGVSLYWNTINDVFKYIIGCFARNTDPFLYHHSTTWQTFVIDFNFWSMNSMNLNFFILEMDVSIVIISLNLVDLYFKIPFNISKYILLIYHSFRFSIFWYFLVSKINDLELKFLWSISTIGRHVLY